VELAVEEDQPFAVDSRGLNRALNGNYDGAIEDFQFFVDQLQDIEPDNEAQANALAKAIAKRKTWIVSLEAGENPFDEETLEALRNE
jgi:hypothetical protein